MKQYKDANECLLEGITQDMMKHCLGSAREFAPEKIKNAREFREEFMEDWFEHAVEEGLATPIEFPFKIRHGELTIWTGFSGHGKTKLLSHFLIHLLAQGERACVASLEVRTRKTLLAMSRCAWGNLIWDGRETPVNPLRTLDDERREAEQLADRVLDWLGNALWLYDHTGIAQWRPLLDDFLFVRRRYGVRQFVIDSLMRLGIMEDDYAQQGEFVKHAATWAQEHDCHVHLVAHKKKNEKGERMGGGGDKGDVKGAASITDNAHNVVEAWRNIDKAQKMSELKNRLQTGMVPQQEYDEAFAKLRITPDGKFILRKQREGEVQDGSRLLWYLWRSFQYTDYAPDDRRHKAACYVPLAAGLTENKT